MLTALMLDSLAEIPARLALYFQYSFVWYAVIVGVLIALCSSLLGVTLVLKRFPLLATAFPMWLLARWRRPVFCILPIKPCWCCR